MAPFEALYGQRRRSPSRCFYPGEDKLYDTDLVKDALEKVKLIQVQLRTTQSKQKIYADQKARDVSFMVSEKVLLKVSPIKGIMRFRKKVKLSSRFIGLFEVLRRVGGDFNTIQLDERFGYEEELVVTIARQDR
ncbi:uncharacterized protein [Nicotiana sylvestris]|uniref:uncharacterized protein n=1 Tax=Nicotiana sylvestris TaxID=4096 RepID=UPI00388C949D